eukprot:IDg18698t1
MENSSDESSDNDTLSYLVATCILPVFETGRLVRRRVGSRPGKKQNMARNFSEAIDRLLRDYFGTAPKYVEELFERRFRITKHVFERIYKGLEGKGIFVRKVNALGKPSMHPI